MRQSLRLEAHREDIRRIVEMNRGRNPRVFGSVLRGENMDTSDLDILIDATLGLSLFDMARMSLATEQLVVARVDVRTPEDIPSRFRDQVVAEAKPI